MLESCYLNFKSCHLNFLIFLFKRSDYKLYFSFFTIITNIGQEKNIKKTLNKLKQKNKKNIKILKFSMKSLTFSCLICALNLDILLRNSQKGKICSKLLHGTAKSWPKVPEHNLERPTNRLIFLVYIALCMARY